VFTFSYIRNFDLTLARSKQSIQASGVLEWVFQCL
jgi:hypothetical protein